MKTIERQAIQRAIALMTLGFEEDIDLYEGLGRSEVVDVCEALLGLNRYAWDELSEMTSIPVSSYFSRIGEHFAGVPRV